MLSTARSITCMGGGILARSVRSNLLPTPAFTRSFTTTRVTSSLPPPLFHSYRPHSALNLRSSTQFHQKWSRGKWSYAKHGLLAPSFSAKHPWVAGFLRISISAAVGISLLIGIVLLHDMSTYTPHRDGHIECSPLSLHPRRGGPKNLPIIESNLDDNEEKGGMKNKPRLVIIGGGWGAVAVLKSMPTDFYNVTVIAPENYFCFTPLLPSACVGTVEVRSLVEPLRRLIRRVHGHFVYGKAIDIEMSERLLEVEIPNFDGSEYMNAYIPYDKLVVACGSKSNEHGVKGLDNCFQLKTIPDAQAIRRRIMSNLETASLPTTTPEQRKQLMSFVVCGGGPTGVELAAELSDMLDEDVAKYYPAVLQDDISITIIQSRDHILNTYSEKISEFAEKRFARTNVKVITNARVSEVTPHSVILSVKQGDDSIVAHEVPSGFTLWSTGIAMQPFTKRLVERLPNQFHSKAVQVDSYLHVEGAPKGTVYAIGDASTIHLNMLDDLLCLWERFDKNHDNKLDYYEWEEMAQYLSKKYPLAAANLEQIREIFQEYDQDGDDALELNEVAEMFMKMAKKITALPATAQVASQQGEYLGGMFTKLSEVWETLQKNDISPLDDDAFYKPFHYTHLGSLAYVGNSAVFDYYGYSVAGGLLAMYAWRSVYWGEQTSMRARFMLMLDWIKRGIFGRDISKF